jgi:transposase
MCHTKRPASLDSGIVVGIDPGLDKHGVSALVVGSCYRLDRRMVDNGVAGMQLLVTLLQEWNRQSNGKLTIGIEEASAYGEALECYLSTAGFQVVVVSERKVARFKEILGDDANDLVDSEAVARLLMVQPDIARMPARQAIQADPNQAQHRRLRQLSRRFNRWTREHTAVCNELHADLRMAWLADYQRFFSRVDGAAALAFWGQYPTPAEAAHAKPAEIADLLRRTSRGRINQESSLRKARDIHSTAQVLVQALGGKNADRWTAWAEDIRMLAGHLAHINAGLERIEKEMDACLETIDSPLLSFKGLGTITAATIHGEMLSIDRFPTADHFARYNGTAPREDSSGRSPKHVKNQRCNKRLRYAFLQLALQAPRYHSLSASYLDHLTRQGHGPGAARLRLARRLSDIVYAMLRDNKAYDPEIVLRKKHMVA